MSTKVRSIFVGGGHQHCIWLQIHIWVVHFYLNLGSTLAVALVPSVSHLNSLWWGMPTLDADPTPDPYLGCTFWLEFRVQSFSGPIYFSPELIVVVVVGRGSTLVPTSVPSLSHLSWLWGVYSRKMWSQLHFFVYRQLSSTHDWIGSLTSDCQWAKKYEGRISMRLRAWATPEQIAS